MTPFQFIFIWTFINHIPIIFGRETIENIIEIYDKCTNLFTNPEVIAVIRSGEEIGNKTCDEMILKKPKRHQITYQMQFNTKQVINQTIDALVNTSLKNGYLIRTESANITTGALNGTKYYAIRYFTNSDFFNCTRDPGLQILRQISGVLYFINLNHGNGLFSCEGSGIRKYIPGLLFGFADMQNMLSWLDSGKQLANEYLPYLYGTGYLDPPGAK